MVRALYAVERQARDASVPARLELRQQQSAPVLAQLREKLFEWKEQLLPKHPMAEAILASLTSTCRRHDVDPQLYLTQLLTNLPSARMSELSAWLPDKWKPLQHATLPSLQNHTSPTS